MTKDLYFDLMHRVHTFCQQAKCRLNSTSTHNQNWMAVHLVLKLLGATQGAMLFVERGLASQNRRRALYLRTPDVWRRHEPAAATPERRPRPARALAAA